MDKLIIIIIAIIVALIFAIIFITYYQSKNSGTTPTTGSTPPPAPPPVPPAPPTSPAPSTPPASSTPPAETTPAETTPTEPDLGGETPPAQPATLDAIAKIQAMFEPLEGSELSVSTPLNTLNPNADAVWYGQTGIVVINLDASAPQVQEMTIEGARDDFIQKMSYALSISKVNHSNFIYVGRDILQKDVFPFYGITTDWRIVIVDMQQAMIDLNLTTTIPYHEDPYDDKDIVAQHPIYNTLRNAGKAPARPIISIFETPRLNVSPGVIRVNMTATYVDGSIATYTYVGSGALYASGTLTTNGVYNAPRVSI